MTFEEAIKELEELRPAVDNVFTFSAEKKKIAIDLAIIAMEYVQATRIREEGEP